jgi:hypothetical protein
VFFMENKPRIVPPPSAVAQVEGQSDQGIGVLGISNSGIGVEGESTSGDGIFGQGQNGVHGKTSMPYNGGVLGENSAPGGVGVLGTNSAGIGVKGQSFSSNDTFPGVYGENGGGGTGVLGRTEGGNGNSKGVHGYSLNGIGVYGDGPIGVYGAGPTAGHFEGNVEINGNISTVNTINVKTDILFQGGDCAEQFDNADSQELEPGTVVTLDEAGAVQLSRREYDRTVAGVISGAGDYKPAIVLDKRGQNDDRVAVALIGKVCCKVDAQYGSIEVGDLLTTSPTTGYAMIAKDPSELLDPLLANH